MKLVMDGAREQSRSRICRRAVVGLLWVLPGAAIIQSCTTTNTNPYFDTAQRKILKANMRDMNDLYIDLKNSLAKRNAETAFPKAQLISGLAYSLQDTRVKTRWGDFRRMILALSQESAQLAQLLKAKRYDEATALGKHLATRCKDCHDVFRYMRK